eukprot:CAMPEP_0197577120 /NCGR_PEP_ID=MMETSP1326-20131121/1869_1 /TAXON_ID=1155430 /ORGANISM="Genus nov. species nov., Strain RCC2288" /LENGTH=567 /DNA_ID=CAMNT_0043140137 /DNA_START=36 /DNA_END=1739 /DNA_ORIENTATION=-
MSGSCTLEGPFGMFPNCDTVAASLFLNAVYGFMLLQAANLISDGSELLLEILSPGLVGGLLLPILGAVPDAAVIVASGLGASKEDAQEQVAIGMGTLAGSTVMLLTIAWSGSLWVGRCDLNERGVAVARTLTRGGCEALSTTGVTTDRDTKLNAKIMMLSCVLFLIVQVPAFAGVDRSKAVDLAAGIAALTGLALYCAFQVLYPELQRRKMAAARARYARRNGAALAIHFGNSVGGILVDGVVNAAALDTMFDQFDTDGNGQVDTHELKSALVAMAVTMDNYAFSEADVAVWVREFDQDGDELISRSEFCAGMTHWVLEHHKHSQQAVPKARRISTHTDPITGIVTTRTQSRYRRSSNDMITGGGLEPLLGVSPARMGREEEVEEEEEDEDEDDEEEDAEGEPLTKGQIIRKSMMLLTIGMVLIATFADPMVGAVSSLSKAMGLPSPFFASFILTPFASNASELISSLYFASKKRKKNISLTYSQVYGAVTMNNTLCFGLFMIVMHAQGLEWTFTAETLCILLVTLVVGCVGASGTTFKTWTGLPVLAMYPLSLLFVIFLDYVVGLK